MTKAGVAGPRSSRVARRASARRRRRGALATAILAAAALVAVPDWRHPSTVGLVMLCYLAAKLVAAVTYRPARDSSAPGRVVAIVPFYNEDPELLRACVCSLWEQARRPDLVVAVDDGSRSSEGAHALRALTDTFPPGWLALLELEVNRGKRKAQGAALRFVSAIDPDPYDFVLTVDSDTTLDPNALSELLRALADPTVQAVTGRVHARNARSNLLTRLIAIRYAAAFLWDRAGQSRVGATLCCCGSCAVYRMAIMHEHLSDYEGQTFLGAEVPYGDDRRLTNYALQRGRVLMQDTAVAYTAVPERFSHYVRQQSRWNRSFFRETLWAIANLRGWGRILSALDGAVWAGSTLAIALAVAFPGSWIRELDLTTVVLTTTLLAYMRAVRFLGSTPDPWRAQIGMFLLAPLYAVLHLLVLMPLRLWSLATLRTGSWGTRAHVEVSSHPHTKAAPVVSAA